MANLDKIIPISISRKTLAITQTGFGVGLCLAHDPSEKPSDWGANEDSREVNSSDFLDSFPLETKIGQALNRHFGQEPSPEKAIVGFVEASESHQQAITRISQENSDFYCVLTTSRDLDDHESIKDFLSSQNRIGIVRTNDENALTASDSTPQPEIQEINFDAVPDAGSFKIRVGLEETVSINFNDANTDVQSALLALSKVEAGLTVTGNFTDGFVITFGENENQDLVEVFDNTLESSSVAVDAEVSQTQAGIPTGHDIASILNGLSFDKIAPVYSSKDDYLDFAWAGRMLPTIPGSATWIYKVLKNVTNESLTSAQESILDGKNYSYLARIAGQNVMLGGKMANGEFIDVVRTAHELAARIQESVFQALIDNDKIPYTNAGMALLENKIREPLSQKVNDGAINEDFSITIPNVQDVPFADRANREVNIEWTASLQGAVHKVIIKGNLTV